jgi:hypothetical protein
MKAAKKRRADAYVKPVGKRAKVVRRKKIVEAPKAAVAALKSATVAAPETVAASTPKAGATPKASAMLTAGAAASKVAAVGQRGAPRTAKVVTLKVKSRVKRPSDMELLLAKTVKESKKFFLVSSSTPASIQSLDIPSSPTPRSDNHDRVELISMMDVVTHRCLSSPELCGQIQMR